MDERLRRSAAHVVVGDVATPSLADPDHHHLSRVLRLRDGATVTVTDGAGRWRPCRWVGGSVEPDGDVVETARRSEPIRLVVAAPKGDRLEWLVQKATEVGVDEIALVTAERSVVRWDAGRTVKQIERLRRIAAEASMQSRRVWLPTIVEPRPALDVLPSTPVAEPGGRPVAPGDTTMAIGPEGGWSPDELMAAGERVSLGESVLRVETAAVTAVVLMTWAAR